MLLRHDARRKCGPAVLRNDNALLMAGLRKGLGLALSWDQLCGFASFTLRRLARRRNLCTLGDWGV